jgi:hypothetical protein
VAIQRCSVQARTSATSSATVASEPLLSGRLPHKHLTGESEPSYNVSDGKASDASTIRCQAAGRPGNPVVEVLIVGLWEDSPLRAVESSLMGPAMARATDWAAVTACAAWATVAVYVVLGIFA